MLAFDVKNNDTKIFKHFANNGGISIMQNYDITIRKFCTSGSNNYVSRFGNTNFLNLWVKYRK